MKKFQYRFETVAKVRRIEMERQSRIFAETELKVKQIEAEMRELIELQDQEVARLKALANRGEILEQLVPIYVRYRENLKRTWSKKRNELRDWQKKAEVERLKLVEKETQRKVMEKLREKDFEIYEEERRKEEIKDQDEVASMLWQRHSGDEPTG